MALGEPDDRTVIEVDRKDRQLLAALAVDPNASTREIAQRTGIPKSTVAWRLQRLEERPEVRECIEGLLALLPQIPAAFGAGLSPESPIAVRIEAAHKLGKGLRVFVERSESDERRIPTTEDDVLNAFRNLTTAGQDSVIVRLREDQGGEDPDGGVVAGDEPPPNPQG